MSSITAEAGDLSTFSTNTITFDNIGNLTAIDGPLAGSDDSIHYRYDAARQQVGIIGPDPDGSGATYKYRAQRMTYDPDGLPILVEQGTVNDLTDSAWSAFSSLQRVTTTYDTYDRPITSALSDGVTTYSAVQTNYDNLNRVNCVATRMNPGVFNSLPDACSLSTQGSYGPDRISQNSYDDAGQLIVATAAYGTATQQATATYTYSPNGLVLTVADAKNNKTTYTYDGFDRLSKTQYPSPTAPGTSSTTDFQTLGYDVNSHVTSIGLRGGASATPPAYDNMGRLTTAADGTTFTYDRLSRQLTSSRSSRTNTYAYDALSHVKSETGSLGMVSYGYDKAGHRTSMTWPDGYYVTYSYDNSGELNGIYENGGTALATYVYDNLGMRTTLYRANGAHSYYGYDNVSRLTSLQQDLSGSTYDQTLTLGYNPAGQIVSRTGTSAAFAITPPSNANVTTAVNGLNQITGYAGTTYAYDSKGNLSSDGTNTYTYDNVNRLTGVSGKTLSYDPAGRLYEVNGTADTRYLYDGGNIIAEYNASGSVLRRYVYGSGDDEPIVSYLGSGTLSASYLVPDERGSVIAITNGSAGLTSPNNYDEYGVPGSSNAGLFQYTGQAWISEVGLYDYKNRFYSAALGRFLQTDPTGYGQGLNWYAYANNDPINGTDTTGLGAQIGLIPADGWSGSDWGDGVEGVDVNYVDVNFVDGMGTTVDGSDAGGVTVVGVKCYYGCPSGDYAEPGFFQSNINYTGSLASPELRDVTFHAKPQSKQKSCPVGPRLVLGGGGSGTLFGLIVGASAGGSASVSIPWSSLPIVGDGSFTGAQGSGSVSITPLVGFGAFAGLGPGVTGGISGGASKPGFHTGGATVFQLGGGDGVGAEVGTTLGKSAGLLSLPTGFKGAIGAYGAFGRQLSANYNTQTLGCR